MGLFKLPYKNVPDFGISARGIKFSKDEEYLRNYFAPILDFISLNDLIGEAVFWLLFPGTICFYLFLVCLIFLGPLASILIALGAYVALDFLHHLIYFKPLNYIVFALGNPIPKIIMILITSIIFYKTGNTIYILYAGLWYFLGDFLEQIAIIPFRMIYLKFIFSLPTNDQVLRNVGLYYRKDL
jgi:hypothetical protein